jgi:hypothetical protein
VTKPGPLSEQPKPRARRSEKIGVSRSECREWGTRPSTPSYHATDAGLSRTSSDS